MRPLGQNEYSVLYYPFRELAFFLDWAQDLQERGWQDSKYRREREPLI